MPCYDCQLDAQSQVKDPPSPQSRSLTIALIGSPNVGKTSLFNALTGLRARTANFPGTTVEQKIGRFQMENHDVEVVDLPGIYSLSAATPEERIVRDVIDNKIKGINQPTVFIVIADAVKIERSLFLISQVLEHQVPVIVALNMMDLAHRYSININVERLSMELGCPVIPMIARTGEGTEQLKKIIVEKNSELEQKNNPPPVSAASGCTQCGHCPFQSRYLWSEKIASHCITTPATAWGRHTEIIDRYLTHPILGLAVFFSVMLVVFYLIFSLANVPMDMIDTMFGRFGAWVAQLLPEGKWQSLVSHGIIGGVGGMLVFLPQICILFFFLALLEDSGYLARAAFVMDRLMRRIGLPGTAFVPLLSAHACAIPAIMSTRIIRDFRDRLVTILVLPLMSCSARIPVYAMITALLFPDNPIHAALVFTGAYSLGIIAALLVAFLLKKTILPGESKPLVLELPEYRVPSLKSAIIYTCDRGMVFVQQAGTIILLISIILWTLSTFPSSTPPQEALILLTQAQSAIAQGDVEKGERMAAEAEKRISQESLSNSYAGRLGKLIEPIVRPLGFDWQIGIGIISSFAAREVIVSTLAIVYGVGDDASIDNPPGLYRTLQAAHRSDGTPVFTMATSISLLVFYVLAMQCLPTQVITHRETNSWKWAAFQLLYMTVLAYTASLITYQTFLIFSTSP